IAELQVGTRVESDARQGPWFRVTLRDGRLGWIFFVAGPITPNFSIDARPDLVLADDGEPTEPVRQDRPMGHPFERVFPIIDPKQVPAPSALLPTETVPIPDRWRLTDQLNLVHRRWFDPYNPNTIKGDRPIHGEDWFFNLGVISDTVYEARQLPTGIGAQSTQRPQSNDQFGYGKQSQFVENLIISLSYLKGDTTFKPPELEFRFVPVINYNYTRVQEVRALNIDPRNG